MARLRLQDFSTSTRMSEPRRMKLLVNIGLPGWLTRPRMPVGDWSNVNDAIRHRLQRAESAIQVVRSLPAPPRKRRHRGGLPAAIVRHGATPFTALKPVYGPPVAARR